MIATSTTTQFLLTLSMLKGIGPAALRKVAALPGFDEIPVSELAQYLAQFSRALAEPGTWEKALVAAEEQLREARKHDAHIISALDPEYPRLLAATKDDPFLLFVQGKLSPQSEKSIAVIGTREPTTHGEMVAARITSFLVDEGWSIVSGLAIGCDAVAHRTALECKGHTVAVLAHGLHTIAPSRHKKLAEQILESGGALVSEYRFGQDVQKQQYVKRDRTQAGLAQGVVMVQSDLVGGSLHAARAALSYDRWLAVPYPTHKDREAGEPKVQANLTIADGTDGERMELLRCSGHALDKLIVVHSREDYHRLVSPAAESAGTDREKHPAAVDERQQRATSFAYSVDSEELPAFEPVYIRPTGESSSGLDALRSNGAIPWPNRQDADAAGDGPPDTSPTSPVVQETQSAIEASTEPVQPDSAPIEAPVDLASEPVPSAALAPESQPDAVRPVEAASTPADTLFVAVRGVIQLLLKTPMKDAEVAAALDVSNAQAKAWLQRLVDEGVLEKQKKPAGYIVKQSRLFE
jgi:DNA protecting protein DprA